MTTHRWLTLVFIWGALSACFLAPREPDCLFDGTCECKRTTDCPSGRECVGGRCLEMPDAGLPGDVGWPCDGDDECRFGPCLPRGPGNGSVCTATCGEDGGFNCPRGWECKQGFGAFPLLCAPPIATLCLACQSDLDCNVTGDRCLLIGGANACGRDCQLTGACPSGYTCRAVRLDAGVARQCFPDSDTCECSALTAGLTRSCSRTNQRGTCFGLETCQPNGAWSGCDAPDASVERCDGIDNDCDGLLDQADPDLDTSAVPGYPACTKGRSCTGRWSCEKTRDGGAAFVCSAHDPTPETCNGADDDCNGEVDDGLLNDAGQYASVRACGSCATDCHQVLRNLAADGGAVLDAAASCEVRDGALTCVPQRCARGFYPSPEGAAQVCERAVTSQCRPCSSASDCAVPGDQCLAVGFDQGLFCAQACDEDAVMLGCTGQVGAQGCCPSGNTCRDVGGRKLCVPEGNSCLCTPGRIGFSRSCFLTAGSTTCVGEQTCSAEGGFGTCDTSKTALELCDGRDNDCDGTADNPFVNTRGTGTYDTDAHCGACQNDCPAKWSPSIQHAIGGCTIDGGVGPKCAIVACTQEAVPGGGACHEGASGECPLNRACLMPFGQCTQKCTSAADCRLGQETCVKGACARTCASDAECLATYGSPSSCGPEGTCEVVYQFVDADREETNGCECPSAQGVIDVPDVYSTYPAPGSLFLDRNCDFVDGTASTSLFVWAQSPSSRGTRQEPFRTIAEAIAAFRTGEHTEILVAQGTYVEQVVMKSGASVFGGYSSDFGRRDVVGFPTLIEAPEPIPTGGELVDLPQGTVHAENLTARTVLAGFTIRAYDVISRPLPGWSAKNSIGVYVKDSPHLVLQNNHIVGGRGGDATPALPGIAGANGSAGEDGRAARECTSATCSGENQPGGSPGQNSACSGATSGNAGANSDPLRSPQDYQTTSGGNGRGGSNGVYNHSDPSQADFCKYDCTVPGSGLAGGAAQNGGDGSAGAPGAGCTSSAGTLRDGDWVSSRGADGSNGSAGRGGGGGGAGGWVRNNNPATCSIGNLVGDLGGSGGGGGAGGCGGARGSGAASGGGSIAVLVVGAAPTVVGNLIDLGFGGSGASGGSGGYGGLGGPGGRGGPNTSVAWCAGQGGPGGRGGNGGAGSGGGGGCGGSAFGIAGESLPVAAYSSGNSYAAAPVNAGGEGGLGGASPGGIGFRGGDGARGIVATVQSF